MICKELRYRRLFPSDSKLCLTPIDHGITIGTAGGLKNINKTLNNLSGMVDGIVLHKGIIKNFVDNVHSDCRLFLHLSASTILGNTKNDKVLITSVEEAVQYGADAVSIHANFGGPKEPEVLRDMGIISRECNKWGMPLMVMSYMIGYSGRADLSHMVRIVQEMGGDICKISYPGSMDATHELIEGVDIPVLIAGGDRMDSPEEVFTMIDNCMKGGAAGVAMGRNIFQADNQRLMAQLAGKLVHSQLTVEECINIYNKDSQIGKEEGELP